MGDFNYRSINWIDHCYEGSSLEAQSFLACVEDCMLTQHVLFPTTDRSVLDEVIARDPSLVSDVSDLRDFATSDHRMI